MDPPALLLALPLVLPAIVLLASFLAALRPPAPLGVARVGLAEDFEHRAHEQQECQRQRHGHEQVQPPVPTAPLHRASRPRLRPPQAVADHGRGTNGARRDWRAVA